MKIPIKIEEETVVARNPDVAWRILGEYLIAITPSDNKVHRCNATGAFIWNCLGKEGMTVGELRQRMEGAFDVGTAATGADIKAFLTEITGKGLVTLA